MSISLAIAAGAPDPQKITTCSSVPPTAVVDRSARASSRSRVVAGPVPELSVWVLA